MAAAALAAATTSASICLALRRLTNIQAKRPSRTRATTPTAAKVPPTAPELSKNPSPPRESDPAREPVFVAELVEVVVEKIVVGPIEDGGVIVSVETEVIIVGVTLVVEVDDVEEEVVEEVVVDVSLVVDEVVVLMRKEQRCTESLKSQI